MKNKYINVNDMRIALHKLLDEGKWLEKETTENIFRAFKDLPKIEIVQCKDCKFRTGVIIILIAGGIAVAYLKKMTFAVVENKRNDMRKFIQLEFAKILLGNTIRVMQSRDDLISRKDAIDALSRSSVYAWSEEEDQIAHDWALKIISELPTKVVMKNDKTKV